MTRSAFALGLLASLTLSACVVDAGSNWDGDTSLTERTRLARETCGERRVASVDEDGFVCVGDEDARAGRPD